MPRLFLCRGCGARKLDGAFHRNAREKSGRSNRCRMCVQRYQKRYREENERNYTPPIGTKRCPRCKKRKSVTKFHGARQARDGLSTWCKICNSEVHANYRQKNDDKIKKMKARDYQKNLISNRTRALSMRRRLRAQVLHAYGGKNPKCVCCREDKTEFLAIDHIRGGGGKHLRAIKNSLYQWLKQHGFPKGFRILCFNCNHAYSSYGYCPHKQHSRREWSLEALDRTQIIKRQKTKFRCGHDV